MDLFILRHGEADKSSDGNDDFSRPLTVAGATDVTCVAEWLKDLGVKFSAIITSPLKRAHQTASIVSKIFNIENTLMNWEELRPEGNRIELFRKLSSEQLFKQESAVLIVGHELYLSSLISEIIYEANASNHVVLKKAGLAKIRITSQYVRTMHGELEWLLTPKLMKNISTPMKQNYDTFGIYFEHLILLISRN
jgi:phosphohistidine phosphatase